MTGFALLLGVAGLAYGAARLVRVDALPFLIVGGLLVRRLPVEIPVELVTDLTLVALAFLLFLAGHELNPHRIRPLGRQAAVAAGLRVLGVGLAGGAAAVALGYPAPAVVVVGLAAGACSPIVGVRLLLERREFFQPGGRLAAGVLLFQGVAVVLAFPLLPLLAGDGLAAVRGALAATALIVAGLAFMRWVAVPMVTRLELNEEVMLLVSFSVLALFTAAGTLAGLPLVAGAFVAGIALSRFPVNGVIRGYLQSTSDLATAVAFTGLGAMVTIPDATALTLAALLAAAVLVLPPALMAAIARSPGLTTRGGVQAGVLAGQTGEFSLAVALHATALGLVGDDIVAVVLLTSAATLALTPLLSRDHGVWRLVTRLPPWRRVEDDASGRILFLGLHHTDLPLIDELRRAGEDVLVVDDDPALVRLLRGRGARACVGDGSRPEVLAAVGADRARAVVVTLGRFRAARRVLESVRGPTVVARVLTRDASRRVRELGGRPVLWARPIAEDFLDWLDRRD